MFNLSKFIGDYVTGRPVSMFEADIQANKETLTREIKGKKVCNRWCWLYRLQFHQGASPFRTCIGSCR